MTRVPQRAGTPGAWSTRVEADMANRTPVGKSIWCDDPRGGGGHSRCAGTACSCDCHNPTHKTCRTCGEVKPRAEFPKAAANFDGLQTRCYECKRRVDAEYRAKQPNGWMRDASLKKYGLMQADYEALLASQGGRCAICRTDDAQIHTSKRGLKGAFHVDHDHRTGKVRGILCGPCNQGLGRFKDNPEALRRAAAYLDGRLV